MGRILETISAILSRLAALLGIKPSSMHRVALFERKLAAHRASNVDRLEAIKEKIQHFEKLALRKKREYDSAKGESRRIIAGEIERLFREADRLRSQERVIASHLERISLAQAKLEEYKIARDRGLDEEDIDGLAVELQEAFDGLRVVDRASRDLAEVEYEAPEADSIDAERRMAEVTGERQASDGLSLETEKRLKQLQIEEG